MLELKLIGDLTKEEQILAARIMSGFHTRLRDVPLEERPEDVVNEELDQLLKEKLSVVIAGIYGDKPVGGIYTIPYFFLDNDILTNSFFGSYFITEPAGNGIGTEFIISLTRIFEELAHRCNAAHLMHNDRYWKGNGFLLKQGYVDMGPHLTDDLRICGRRYFPIHHNLAQSESKIVESFIGMMHK